MNSTGSYFSQDFFDKLEADTEKALGYDSPNKASTLRLKGNFEELKGFVEKVRELDVVRQCNTTSKDMPT